MSSMRLPAPPISPKTTYAAIRALIVQYKRQNVDGDTFVLVEPLTRALEAQYQDLDNALYHVIREAHEMFSAEPTGIDPVDLPSMRRILYCLLDLEHPELLPSFHPFKDVHLPICEEDLMAKLEEQTLEEKFDETYGDFPALWLRNQPSWCPFIFEPGPRLRVRVPPQCIIPFYSKRALRSHDHGQEPHDNRAKLYEVHIPDDLIKSSVLEPSQLMRYDDPVSSALSSPVNLSPKLTPHQPGSEKRTYWRFALKEFPESLKQSWEREVLAFRALGAQSGIITYYGCYESETRHGRHTFSILLEFADYDLNGTIREEEPPVSPDEIKSFYESMQELAVTLSNIHCLDI